MFTTSYSKLSKTFSLYGIIKKSTLKLVNNTRWKNLGKRVFEAKIIIEFDF